MIEYFPIITSPLPSLEMAPLLLRQPRNDNFNSVGWCCIALMFVSCMIRAFDDRSDEQLHT